MNLIPVIRETLGLKENEEFQILKNDGTTYVANYRFADNNKLQWFDSDTGCWESSRSTTLENIVYGKVSIKKLPFKPKPGGTFYYVSLYIGRVRVSGYDPGSEVDESLIKSGNCYRTKEEAAKHIDEWMEKLYGKDWRELYESNTDD